VNNLRIYRADGQRRRRN